MSIRSESNLEIVHDDGTITDKTDGIRRPYDEHVARIASALAQGDLSQLSPAPVSKPNRFLAVALGATGGAIFGVVAEIIVRHIH